MLFYNDPSYFILPIQNWIIQFFCRNEPDMVKFYLILIDIILLKIMKFINIDKEFYSEVFWFYILFEY